jgi:hypothetical protein
LTQADIEDVDDSNEEMGQLRKWPWQLTPKRCHSGFKFWKKRLVRWSVKIECNPIKQ